MAHKKRATQFQLISVLVLLALFTHQNIFWLAALILVVLDFPDLMTPLNSIARSLEKATGREPALASAEPEPAAVPAAEPADETMTPDEAVPEGRRNV